MASDTEEGARKLAHRMRRIEAQIAELSEAFGLRPEPPPGLDPDRAAHVPGRGPQGAEQEGGNSEVNAA